MIDVALLGTGGGMPIPNRFLSSMLISYKGRKILVDCGEGTQVSMRLLKWGFKSIDVILLTHIHGDHILGLPGLFATMGNSGRINPITIIGPKGIRKFLEGLMVAVPYLPYSVYLVEASSNSFRINFTKEGLDIDKANGSLDYEDLIISTIELDHSSSCIGYSFCIPRRPKFNPKKARSLNIPKNLWKNLQNGQSIEYEGQVIKPNTVLGKERRGIKLSYITDTRPIDPIVNFIRESDLFICEGTYGDNDDLKNAIKNKHMTFAEAADLASRANVRELWLTHFSTAMDNPEGYIHNATDVFPNTKVGYDRMMTTLNYKDDY